MTATIWLPRVAMLLTLALVLLLLLVVASVASAPSPSLSAPASPSTLTERQRFGFITNFIPDWYRWYDIERLRAGWFVMVARSGCIPAPEGMERAMIIPLRSLRDESGWDLSRLYDLVEASPHTLWLVGNEPDCIYQDSTLPEEYATVYHDIYTLIKNLDPAAQVSPGGIVQPTPLRLQWLDRVLTAYQNQYGTAMPVDVWNIHNAILNEQEGEWGADIPPGIDATEGVVRDVQDNDRIDIFQQQIWDFRQWMADNGYGGYPLLITEYGILLPAEMGYDTDRVNAFMDATFAFMQTATDTTLGDPTDGYRLVQRWAWYSLDELPYNGEGFGFNGNLFDPVTNEITPFGQNFASHTSTFPDLEYVDLAPVAWSPATGSMTRTVHVDVRNEGTSPSGPFTISLEYSGLSNGTQEWQIDSVGAWSSVRRTITLTSSQEGIYVISVQVDPDKVVTETVECNNESTIYLAVPPRAIYLPLSLHYAPQEP